MRFKQSPRAATPPDTNIFLSIEYMPGNNGNDERIACSAIIDESFRQRGDSVFEIDIRLSRAVNTTETWVSSRRQPERRNCLTKPRRAGLLPVVRTDPPL
jgi:hypothetical protein